MRHLHLLSLVSLPTSISQTLSNLLPYSSLTTGLIVLISCSCPPPSKPEVLSKLSSVISYSLLTRQPALRILRIGRILEELFQWTPLSLFAILGRQVLWLVSVPFRPLSPREILPSSRRVIMHSLNSVVFNLPAQRVMLHLATL